MIGLFYCNISNLMTDSMLRDKALKEVAERRRVKALRYAFLDDQCRSLAAGLCLKTALSSIGMDYDTCQFSEGAKGKLSLDPADGVFFNLSHAGDYAICGLSDSPIGVDMESLSMKGKKMENLERIALRNFTEDELEFWKASESEEEKRLRFASVFTGKEAYGKLLGVGISYQLNEISTLNNAFLYRTVFDQYMISIARENISGENITFTEVDYA